MKIGIDEVGRGCLAGPITVAAVLVPAYFKYPTRLPELKDSKLMTCLQREVWYEWVREEGITKGIITAIASASSLMIDRINVSEAANLAAWRAFNKILKERKISKANIILDGGLFIKSRSFQNNREFLRTRFYDSQASSIGKVKTIFGADKKFKEVKLAAIMAKVTRDAYMRKMAENYPGFGFERHKGYGTKEHFIALGRGGFIEGVHRRTFLKKYLTQ